MKTHQLTFDQSGYILTSLLVFIVVILVITTTSVVVSISGFRSQTYFQGGLEALVAADSGAENAILRLLRDPAYSGETLQVGEAEVVITVGGVGPQTITVVADSGAYERSVQVLVDRVDGMLQVLSWNEI
ncbi:MAG TPA: hypothetical protein PKJ26_01730 [Candidatus Woesebacteria bacterium]|nr:hypothetical protein [Candidatus Woesebacteria bacterium]